MDIYTILASKPHNPHYLNRYITFIEQCQHKNDDYEGYTEKHHICPKSMFPEYKCFRRHSWNRADLTPRQHFIAHIMLWKVYKSSSMARAIWYMSNGNWKKCISYSKIYDELRNFLIPHWKEQGIKISKVNIGKTVVKDEDGNIFRVDVHDPLYVSGKYVGHTSGKRVVCDDSGKKFMSDSNEYQSIHKDMIPIKMDDGSIKKFHRNSDIIQNGKYSAQFKDTIQVKDSSDKNFRVHKDDPRYLSGEVVAVMKNKVTVKDEYGNTLSVDSNHPKILSGEYVGVNKGTITITDGNTNKRISPNDKIPHGWKRGMTKRSGWKKSK
jgi:hypothetical protein